MSFIKNKNIFMRTKVVSIS